MFVFFSSFFFVLFFLLQLFFRAGTLAKLEEQRDEQTKRNLSLFQASCRGYLARQAFKKRKVGDRSHREGRLCLKGTVNPPKIQYIFVRLYRDREQRLCYRGHLTKKLVAISKT